MSSARTNQPDDLFPASGRIAAFDYGTVRIGIAVCDPDRILASPLEVHPAASKDSGSQLSGEAKPNPKPLMPDMPRHAAQQKSQTPLITAFGSECLGLSGPLIAAEGLEQVLSFRGKTYKLSFAGDSLGIFPSEQ